MDRKPPVLPPEFWSTPLVAAALADCDIPALLEEIRRACGWTQSDLALAVGYSQSWVSKVVRRVQPLTIDQVREISRRLGIPIRLLRFGDAGGEGLTGRREAGGAAEPPALPSPPPLPLPRGTRVDETTAAMLTAITGGQRRLDATTPARDLARGVVAHVEMAGRLLARAGGGPPATRLAAAVSEAAGLAAWLHMDMHDLGTARAYYRLAVARARQAGDELLAAYMIGSLAAFEIDADDPVLGLTHVAEARRQLGSIDHPTPRAWLASIEALAHATAGCNGHGERRAAHALQMAEDAVADTPSAASPPWPWVFPFDHAKLAGYRALVAVRLGRPEQALAAFEESLSSAQPAPKQRAVLMLEVATALRQGGRFEHDTERIEEAFRLGVEALQIAATYRSERVVQRARRFRREYSGPRTPMVREFDHQLRTALQTRTAIG